MNKNQKHELRVMELENKKLDVEIKQDQLEKSRLQTGKYRKEIEFQAIVGYKSELLETVRYQGGQIERLRWYLVARTKEMNSGQDRIRELFNENVDLKKELDSLRTTKAIKFVLWVRQLVSPIVRKKGFTPAVLNSKTPFSSRSLNLSPEILAMSADEFKKRYIDPIILVDPSAQ